MYNNAIAKALDIFIPVNLTPCPGHSLYLFWFCIVMLMPEKSFSDLQVFPQPTRETQYDIAIFVGRRAKIGTIGAPVFRAYSHWTKA